MAPAALWELCGFEEIAGSRAGLCPSRRPLRLNGKPAPDASSQAKKCRAHSGARPTVSWLATSIQLLEDRFIITTVRKVFHSDRLYGTNSGMNGTVDFLNETEFLVCGEDQKDLRLGSRRSEGYILYPSPSLGEG